MVDFGPTSVTNTVTASEFGFNTPFLMKEDALDKTSTSGEVQLKVTRDFKEKNTPEGKNSPSELVFKTANTSGESTNLNDSKDSDEGFSSSFSPSSEPQMLQQETSGVSSAFWGSQRDDFLHHELPMGVSSSPLMFNTPPSSNFSSTSALRRGTAPGAMPAYNSGTNRRPFPAVSTLLASNKAVANALGVSNWNASPSPSSTWPNNSSSNAVSSNWPQSRPQLPFPMSLGSQQNSSYAQSRSSKFTPFPISSLPQKPYKNGRPVPTFNSTPTSSSVKNSSPFGLQNQLTSQSGLDVTVVDDITQLTNTFSNLTTSSEVNTNGLFPSQVKKRFST